MPRPDGSYRGVERLPPPSNPPPRELRTEVDRNTMSDADVVRTFHGIRTSSAVIVAVITSAASIIGTYFATHAAPVNCASAGDMNAAQKSISELRDAVGVLTTTVNKNGDLAHNETAAVALESRLSATDTKQTIARLSDKIDTLMRGK